MASIAYDDYDDRPAKPPISLHPAFPGIVALWFSALLGLGSLVLPPVLLEKILTGTLFAPDDPAECAASLARLLSRRAEWPAMRELARAHVASRHDWARNARRYQGIYQALVSRAGESRFSAAA